MNQSGSAAIMQPALRFATQLAIGLAAGCVLPLASIFAAGLIYIAIDRLSGLRARFQSLHDSRDQISNADPSAFHGSVS